MYQLVYMKADFEPWWQFESWQDHIITVEEFAMEFDCLQALERKVQYFRTLYTHEKYKQPHFWAFWNEEEQVFCDGCDEDLQVYHGLLIVSE